MPTPADPLATRWVDIDDLTPLPGNPRRGDIDTIARSLDRFGQRYPIVVRAGTVVAGNHRLAAARELGWTRIAVVDADDLTDDEARAFALADNRTGDLGLYDEDALAEFLDTLDLDLLPFTGYDEADLTALLAGEGLPDRATLDPSAESDDDSDSDSDDSDGNPYERDDALLRALDVSIADPEHETTTGQIWRLGPHTLVVGSVMADHHLWAPLLTQGTAFVPYPSPMVPAIAVVPDDTTLILVQPDTYLAGHVLDKWASVHGSHTVELL